MSGLTDAIGPDPKFRHVNCRERKIMSVAKTIEITSTSKKSFDDAIKQGITKAGESLSNITGAWVMDQSVAVSRDKITEYEVRMRLTFVLK
jgi:flavin-binding protein dodecin